MVSRPNVASAATVTKAKATADKSSEPASAPKAPEFPVKGKNLQNPANKREIVADEALKKVFGKDKASMFEINKLFSQHLT